MSLEDEDLIMQVLEGLPREFEMIVTILNARYKVNNLTIESLREELNKFYDRMRGKKVGKFKSSDDDGAGGNEESALITGNFKGRCRGCGKFGHQMSDCPDEKKNKETKKFQGKCFHCGKKGHKKTDCWELKKSDKANTVQEDDEDSEYALNTWCQGIDVKCGTSTSDDAAHDIIDWKGGLNFSMMKAHDIIDYSDDDSNGSFVRIDNKSWNKRSYWNNAEILILAQV